MMERLRYFVGGVVYDLGRRLYFRGDRRRGEWLMHVGNNISHRWWRRK